MKIKALSKEPTEMERVMENITRVETEIQQKIFQLGQMYYEDNKDGGNTESKYFAIVDLINKLDLNRKGFYKNKLRLEGQMMCENCGSVIPYGSMYCNVCGKKADEKQENVNPSANVAADANTEALKCKQCGAVLEPDSLFCVSCGAKVEANDAVQGEGNSDVL